MGDLLDSAIDSDQVIVLQVDLLESSSATDPRRAAQLRKIRSRAVQNARALDKAWTSLRNASRPAGSSHRGDRSATMSRRTGSSL
ncbi:MAG: hypothetical protein ABSF83_00335 [Nitrososphaerales archaeon]|jgi:hypothetical protein